MTHVVSRRELLKIASGLALGAAWGNTLRALQADGAGWAGWPVGVQSYSLRNFNTLDAIRHIQGMGIHFVELYSPRHLDLKATDEQIAETKKLLNDAKIKLNAHGVNSFSGDHEANRRIFEFAKKAGIRNVTAAPTPDAFSSLEKLCAEYDVRIAIHNHGPKDRYNKISDVVNAVKDRHPLIGACVDTGHFIRSKEDPVAAVRQLKGRVFGVHLKDDSDQEGGSRNVILGKAHLDVPGLFRALKETNFPQDGSLSLEYEANPQNPVDDMKACLAVIKDAVAKVPR
jgi:sugar phosphate isomerase/epimerase